MKQRNRKRFYPAFKARVALEAVQERESLAQLGKKFGVHAAEREGPGAPVSPSPLAEP